MPSLAASPGAAEPTPSSLDRIHHYLSGSLTTETGLDLILPVLLDQPHLHQPTATRLDQINPDQPHHAQLIRAVGHALTGHAHTANTIIANTRARMTVNQKLDWVDRIQGQIGRIQRQPPTPTSAATQQALEGLLVSLVECPAPCLSP